MRLDIEPFYISSARMDVYPVLPNSSKREMPWGRPDVDNPIFAGASAERILITERLETSSQRLTGAKYPRPRQRGAREHEIRIEQIWLTSPDLDDSSLRYDWVLERDALYVVAFSWHDFNPSIADSQWYARIYYGVATPSRATDSTIETLAATDDKVLVAMFYIPKRGTGEIPTP
jgi:hypothetical protein